MTMKLKLSHLLPIALLAAGCASKPKGQPLGSERAARELYETDAAFARMSMQRGTRAAYEFYTTPVSVQLPPVGEPIRGTQAILDAVTGPPGSTMNWHPENAEVAMSGEVGWTWGTYEYRGNDPQGRPVVNAGRYVTIWRRRLDGAWRVAVDIGNVRR